ncbi:MAG TPA: DMT family transporter [Anaerovoracaceae bacterium]|nr:DMT family transporter [Anaerovoracaceae bacterium]
MKKKTIFEKKLVVVILAVSTCLLWGSAFPMIKAGYLTYDIASSDIASQILFAGVRFTLSGILIILIGSFLQRKWPKVEKCHVTKIIKLSMFQTIGQYVFFYMGLAYATGSNAAIIDGSAALVTVIIAGLVYKEDKLNLQKGLGSALGFAGILIVAVSGGNSEFGFSIAGEGMLMISTLSCGFSAVLIKIYSQHVNPVFLCGYQFITGGVILSICSYSLGGRLSGVELENSYILIYLAVLSMLAYTTWSILLKYNSAAKIGVYAFLVPVFGVIMSAIILKENPANIYILSSLILVCLGIILVNKNSVKIDRKMSDGA